MTAKPVPKGLTLSPSTITRRLTLGVLLAHLFIFSLAGLWLYDDYIKRNAHAAELTLTLSHMLEEYLAGRIEKIDITLLAVVDEFERQAANGGIDEKTINEFIRRHQARLPEIMSLRALDAGGTLKYGTGVNLIHPINNAGHEYFILQRDNARAGLVIVPPVFTRVDKKWAIPLSRRFNMPDGSFGGVVYINLPIEGIISIFSTTNIGENGSVTLMDGESKIIARHPAPDGIVAHIGKSDLPSLPQGFVKGQTWGTYATQSLLDNVERTYSYHKVDDYQLYIAVGMSSKDYLAGWREELSKTAAFLALFSLGAMSLSWLVARSWKRQIALMRNLEESETRLNTTQQLAKIGGWEYDVETQTTLWTDELLRIHDLEPQEIAPGGQEHIEKSLECYEPDDRPMILAAFERCARDGVPYELEFPFTTVKGRKLWIRTAGNPVFANGKVVKVIGYIMDITERKVAEEALQESEERHRAIMETANDAIICINQNGKVFMWNPSAERIFGYSEEEMTGRDMHDFITPYKYREHAHKGLSDFLATGEGAVLNKTTEITALHRDGSEFPVELSIAPVRMKNGWGASAIIRDITARKEWENKLTETNQKLKRAMDDIERTHSLLVRQEKLAAMGQLSAGVAHELKNPLNIISTSTQLMMMEEGLTDEVAESGKIIMEQINRAVKIIDNLREFARERKPERKEISLCPFIEKTLGLVAYEMRGEGIEIAKECPPESIRIMGDEDQLAQVFLNITNNARDSMNMRKKSCSFEEAEKIGWKARLTVRTRVEDGKAKISFGDNGVGISEEHKRKLFTPFFTTKGETKGTGLGIAIAFGIIENHGGTIDFESEEGKGALFTVTIPLAGE